MVGISCILIKFLDPIFPLLGSDILKHKMVAVLGLISLLHVYMAPEQILNNTDINIVTILAKTP